MSERVNSRGILVSKRHFIAAMAALVVLAVVVLSPAAPGLSYEGKVVLGIIAAGVIMWVTEAIPLVATALLMLVAMPILGVCSFTDAFGNTAGSTVFFLMGTFAFTVALDATTLPTRICGFVLRWAGNDSRKVILGFMVACALLSLVMSDVAACGVFISVGKKLLELNKAKRGKSALGMAMMVAIPWASYAGGIASMAGNGCNVLTVSLFSEFFGTTMTFAEWSMLGAPFSIVLLLFCWFWVVRWFKPEDIEQETIDETMREVGNLGKFEPSEIKTFVVIASTMVLWIASSWISALNTAEIAVIAMVFLSIPGFNPISGRQIVKRMNWEIIILIMCVISVAHFVVATGAGEWLVDVIVAAVPEAARQPLVLLAIVSALGALVHNVVPVGPAVAGILAYPLGSLAVSFGIPVYAMLMVVAWQASVAFILPLDCVPVLTYSTGYYRMSDYVKAGIVPTIVLVIMTVTILPALCTFFGLP